MLLFFYKNGNKVLPLTDATFLGSVCNPHQNGGSPPVFLLEFYPEPLRYFQGAETPLPRTVFCGSLMTLKTNPSMHFTAHLPQPLTYFRSHPHGFCFWFVGVFWWQHHLIQYKHPMLGSSSNYVTKYHKLVFISYTSQGWEIQNQGTRRLVWGGTCFVDVVFLCNWKVSVWGSPAHGDRSSFWVRDLLGELLVPWIYIKVDIARVLKRI